MAIVGNLRSAARFLILTAALLGGVGAFVSPSALSAQPSTGEVADLPADAEAKLAISKMLHQSVMRTRAGGKFAPTEPSTLGEYLVSVQQLFRLPQPRRAVNFTDVPPSSPYYAAVQAAAPYLNRQAICFGCALSSNLYPEQSLTRAQSTVTLVSILNARGTLPLLDGARADAVLQGVEDTKNLSPLARRLVATGISGGILSLFSARRPELSAVETRASTAVTLDRVQTKFQVPEVRPAQ
jgi:hypothetical protein